MPNYFDQWPPAEHREAYRKYNEWSAWLSGDPERLKDVYARKVNREHGWSRYWSRVAQGPGAQKAELHVPLAGDLSSISSGLLFGVAPRVRIRAAHEAPGPIGEARTGDPEAVKTEERLKEIIESGGVLHRLVEAAETASALGGAFLYPVWDEEIADYPLVVVAQADSAIPTFRYGLLSSVIFHEEVFREDKKVVRHFEEHLRGSGGGNAIIRHSLYEGTETEVGEWMGDAALLAHTGFEPLVELPFPELDVEYLPNMRPNRLWRSSPLGQSDYSGVEGLFDSLDETYASWMRDIRLAKARIIVPREYLDELGAFDVDHEVYNPVNMEPAMGAESNPIIAQQFQIRHEAHLATALELVERVVSNAGYSPQTYGLHIMGRAESGTAMRIRENRTMMTMARKGSWWTPALERLFSHLLQIDAAIFKSGIEPLPVDVEMSDAMIRDPVELAQTANVLKQAQAASTQERVRMIHPDWSPEEVAAEVQRIMDDEPAVPDLAGSLPPEEEEEGRGKME